MSRKLWVIYTFEHVAGAQVGPDLLAFPVLDRIVEIWQIVARVLRALSSNKINRGITQVLQMALSTLHP